MERLVGFRGLGLSAGRGQVSASLTPQPGLLLAEHSVTVGTKADCPLGTWLHQDLPRCCPDCITSVGLPTSGPSV